ncbi:hypothetical protein GCM10010149_88970 [Nonomuraea roseoviolacea subsp. roseoviolacea]|uniref:hypothetical protein n=1 Tax=Nonomuraea roseoviolacea TaxID=103837 RepID=UPI0031D9B576
MSEIPELPEAPFGENLVRANLVWDMLVHEDASEMLQILGMVPPGPDGQAMACEDSHRRLAMAEPLDTPIAILSAEISEIYIKAILGEAAKELGEEVVEDLTSTYEEFLGAGLKVAIANLMAAGVLTYNLRTVR